MAYENGQILFNLGVEVLIDITPVSNPHLSDFGVNFEAPLSLRGAVTKQNVRIPCKVRLYDKQSGRFIKEVATDDQGNYEFTQISKMVFFIVAHDPASQFNAVIQDNVVPK